MEKCTSTLSSIYWISGTQSFNLRVKTINRRLFDAAVSWQQFFALKKKKNVTYRHNSPNEEKICQSRTDTACIYGRTTRVSFRTKSPFVTKRRGNRIRHGEFGSGDKKKKEGKKIAALFYQRAFSRPNSKSTESEKRGVEPTRLPSTVSVRLQNESWVIAWLKLSRCDDRGNFVRESPSLKEFSVSNEVSSNRLEDVERRSFIRDQWWNRSNNTLISIDTWQFPNTVSGHQTDV